MEDPGDFSSPLWERLKQLYDNGSIDAIERSVLERIIRGYEEFIYEPKYLVGQAVFYGILLPIEGDVYSDYYSYIESLLEMANLTPSGWPRIVQVANMTEEEWEDVKLTHPDVEADYNERTSYLLRRYIDMLDL